MHTHRCPGCRERRKCMCKMPEGWKWCDPCYTKRDFAQERRDAEAYERSANRDRAVGRLYQEGLRRIRESFERERKK